MAASSPASSSPSSTRAVSWLTAVVALAAVVLALLLPEQLDALVQRLQLQLQLQLEPQPPAFDCGAAERFLTDENAVRGFHVLCIKAWGNDSVQVSAFKDGSAPAVAVEAERELKAVKRALEKALGIHKPRNALERKLKQPYSFFSPEGRKLASLGEMVDSVVFLFEGGQFIWPGVRVGHRSALVAGFDPSIHCR